MPVCFLSKQCAYKGLQPKSLDFYTIENKKFVGFEIDYHWFLQNLSEKNEIPDIEANKFLFVKER